jgi:mono/diheme cytochrome c family protein
MRQLIAIALLTWLASQGCADVDGDLPRAYRRLDVPAAWLMSMDAQTRGVALFREHCALCHGERGDGRGVRQEGLASAPRDFTDPRWRASISPRRVFFAIREGRQGTAMPNWKALNEQDTWALTAYVLALGDRR